MNSHKMNETLQHVPLRGQFKTLNSKEMILKLSQNVQHYNGFLQTHDFFVHNRYVKIFLKVYICCTQTIYTHMHLYIVEWATRHVDVGLHKMDLFSLEEMSEEIRPVRTTMAVTACDDPGKYTKTHIYQR